MTRPVRDILAEALWLEPDIMRKPWARWNEVAPDECERVRMRADHLMRLLSDMGVEMAVTGGEQPKPPVPSGVIWQYRLADSDIERLIRKGPLADWYIATIVDGKEVIEHTFQLELTHGRGGMVLTGAPEAKSIPNLGRELAAALEIYRLNAAGMGGGK